MGPLAIALLVASIASSAGSTAYKMKTVKDTEKYTKATEDFEKQQLQKQLKDAKKQAMAKALGITDNILPGLPSITEGPKRPDLSKSQTASAVLDLLSQLSGMGYGETKSYKKE